MAQYQCRTYIGGKLFSTGTVTSASLTKPRMSTERAMQIAGQRAGADARRCKTRESIAEDRERAELVLRGKFKTSAELAVLMREDGESDESDI